MKVKDSNQVFNLMDTNGRRNDVVNALQGYIRILDEVYDEVGSTEWTNYPNNLTQFLFYEKAINESPDVFKKHEKYDYIKKTIEKYGIEHEFESCNIDKIKRLCDEYVEFFDSLDIGVESRARHYTSNLVKLGLTDSKRTISDIGFALNNNNKLQKDVIEEILPIDKNNLLFLRQLMKLRIFTKEEDKFYSPLLLAFYILLKYDKVQEDKFSVLIQGMNPYTPVDNIDNYVDDYISHNKIPLDFEKLKNAYYDYFLLSDEVDQSVCQKTFKNQKSSSQTKVYCKFYSLLFAFNEYRTQEKLDAVIGFYKENKSALNKAFGYGNNIFDLNRQSSITLFEFMTLNDNLDIFTDEFNLNIYKRFILSKQIDVIKEYADTTVRLLKVTGIFKFKNGLVELAYKDLFEIVFKNINLGNVIFGTKQMEKYDYEKTLSSFFMTHHTTTEILGIDEAVVQQDLVPLYKKYNVDSINDMSDKLSKIKQEEFNRYVKEKYPKEKALEIFSLFSDRNNDNEIKKIVNPNATVPTIYEYMLAIVWYYFSDCNFDLLNSLNLTLNADFEPETHAGGGMGDIVINYPNLVIMLEATLMNKNAQKRGEWEPVLRHSVNLKVDCYPKKTITFFVADELDNNTINIWRAVASVPLESSTSQGEFADNVVIMPLKSAELINIINDGMRTSDLIDKVEASYSNNKTSFDFKWREKILY